MMKKTPAKKQRVLVALSGGIDSAVSTYLLIKQGYEVEAAFMKNWSSTAGLKYQDCPWLADRQEALRVAAFLKIPLHTLDFEKQYRKNVMSYFFTEYKKGRTPNPDVMCNKKIKFKLLYNWAMKNGFDFLATGHYAKVVKSKKLKVIKSKTKALENLRLDNFQLARSADEFKDQTYFIYNIKAEQLPHLLFPIGGMKKSAVRILARKIKLPNAERKESMGLCFVGKVRLKQFLGQKIKPKTGLIVSSANEILGKHEGLFNYTIGQRQGIKIGGGGPFYVFDKDLKSNKLYVTNNPEDSRLLTKDLQIHSVNWISPSYNLKPKTYNLFGRFRHQGELIPLTIHQLDKNHHRVRFKYPQKAVASGQSLVLYKGKECVGGGVIA